MLTSTTLINNVSIGNLELNKNIEKEEDKIELAEKTASTEVETAETPVRNTEDIVREYFKDIPIMTNIAFCESRFRQFEKNGEIFRGKVNSNDVGVMQVNTFYHLKKSKELNMDIFTLEGNLSYARYLFEKEGAQPWMSSSKCWIPKSNLIAKK